MAVNINVPSQVKTYANLAAFPATGALKTIYIAEDTNKTYRWTGSVYTEISASAAMTWGAIGGTLSNQTDLQNALDAKVPTSRTLTINGVTQDLSADRTFTISTGITIGTTAIASGTVGRVLFQGTGNVVQQSSSLFWDATNNRLGVGTSTPAQTFQVYRNTSSGYLASFNSGATLNTNASLTIRIENANLPSIQALNPGAGGFNTFALNPLDGNILIGTTTDAGFRLDVNGTARVQGNTTIVGTSLSSLTVSNGATTMINTASSGIAGSDFRFRLWTNNQAQTLDLYGSGDYDHQAKHGFRIGNTERLRIFNTGNVLIQNGGTFTDAGFRLDVNGTARFNGNLTFQTTSWILDNSNAIMHRGGFNVESIAFNLSRMVFTDNNGFVFNGNNSAATLTASSIVDIQSTTKGFLPPRMTTTQKNAIASPAAGLMVYDTTLNVISYYNGSMWI